MSTRWGQFYFWLYLLILIGAEATITNPADPDLWHRLALGEFLCQTGHFPPGDTFSYLSDYKHIADHEWGSAIIFYGLYQWAGLDVFVGVKLVTLTLTMVLLVWAGLYHRQPTLLTAAFYALVLLALLPSFLNVVRCMIFSHIFFALWLYWFQCERHGRPIPTFLYALTMVIWANLHGGFVVGLGWLLMVGVVELMFAGLWKKWFLRLGICLLATLINPFGLRLWVSTARALMAPRGNFNEWQPVSWWPDLFTYPGYKLLLLGLVAAFVIQLYRRGWAQMDRPVIVLMAVFLVVFIAARNTSLFAVVAGALVPGLFSQEPFIGRDAHPLHRLGYMGLGTTLVLIPLYAALIILPGVGFSLEYPHISSPRDPVAYLQSRKIRGNLLVPFNYGSYALWFLRGQMRVSMDGRYDLVYRPETYRRVDDFFQANGNWHSLLTTPAPDAILVPMADAVYPKLQAEPGWREAYHDDTDAVFLPQ